MLIYLDKIKPETHYIKLDTRKGFGLKHATTTFYNIPNSRSDEFNANTNTNTCRFLQIKLALIEVG